jgi:hypothetical protein
VKGFCHVVKDACQADRDLSQARTRDDQPDRAVIRLTDALVSFCDELVSLSNPPHKL